MLSADFLKTAQLLRTRYPDLEVVVPLVNAKRREQFERIKAEVAPELTVHLLNGQGREAMIASDAALLASGTAALECMLAKCPMVVGYRMKPFTFWLAQRLVKTPYVSLPNLLAGREIVTELLQHDCVPDKLAAALMPLLEEEPDFVLHLGDFIYEVVQTPAQVAKNGRRYDRVITFPVTFKHGKAVARNRFTVPGSLDDYRALYHAYLQDPDLQDARARWPFVCIWDNHEISWNAWQSIFEFAGTDGWVPGQTLKVAGNQAWFEYQPARVLPPGTTLDTFNAPNVQDVLLKPDDFDDTGLGTEPNNLAAINSLIIYRALRWGRHIDLLLTDNRSFRSRDPGSHDEIGPLFEGDTLGFVPEELWAQLDAGRAYDNGNPRAKLVMGDKSVDNYVARAAPQTMLGAKQKAWFLDKLRGATATWKVWGNSLGALDTRVDPQNLPPGLGKWKAEGYGLMTVYD